MLDWVEKGLKEMMAKRREKQREKLTKERIEKIKLLAKFESFVKAGVLRVIYSLWLSPMRYAELEEVTGLPRATLIKALDHLKSMSIVKTEMRKVTLPRKENVPYYMLTEKGVNMCNDILFIGFDAGILDEMRDYFLKM